MGFSSQEYWSGLSFPLPGDLGDPEIEPGKGFPGSSVGKESTCKAEDPGLIPGLGRFPWRRDRLPTPVFLGFRDGWAGKEFSCKVGDLGSIPWRRERLPTSGFWPGELHGSNLGFLHHGWSLYHRATREVFPSPLPYIYLWWLKLLI